MAGPPATVNLATDRDIPQQVFSRWIETGKARQLRRPLTAEERTALIDRRDELAPYIAPYPPAQLDGVALALLEMYDGFTSMRGGEDAAAARVDSAARLLSEFPFWAISEACSSIRRDGVWRDGKFDRRWPPNDAEIVQAVREKAKLYSDPFDRCVALLAATVEQQG